MERKKNINELEDDLLQRAFDADEEMPMPEDYILDEINQKSVDYLKSVEKERTMLEKKHSRINNSIQMEYSLNVNNNSAFKDNYNLLKITDNWIQNIREEFEFMQSSIQSNILLSVKNSHLSNWIDILNKYKLQQEYIKELAYPTDLTITELAPNLTNRMCFKLISHFDKLLSHSTTHTNLMLWIYFILACVKTPIVDENNSDLYQLNKSILKAIEGPESLDKVHLKIIHVIISEVFGQKIIIRNKL